MFELSCDGLRFYNPASDDACCASVEEIVPLGRRATTLLSGSPHGYSMSTCLNEAAWTLRVPPERDRSVHASPTFGEGIALR